MPVSPIWSPQSVRVVQALNESVVISGQVR